MRRVRISGGPYGGLTGDEVGSEQILGRFYSIIHLDDDHPYGVNGPIRVPGIYVEVIIEEGIDGKEISG